MIAILVAVGVIVLDVHDLPGMGVHRDLLYSAGPIIAVDATSLRRRCAMCTSMTFVPGSNS
jgi:hypothetical protein